MPAIAIVLVFGMFMNTVSTEPQNMEEFNQAFANQFENPVIVAEYKVNE